MNWSLLQNSLLLASLTTALAVVLGLGTALTAATLPTRWRNLVLALAVLALALPPFLVTNCWLDLLGHTGAWRSWLPWNIYSLGGAVWVLSLLLWPITLFAVTSAWRRLEPEQLECEPALTGLALLRWLLLPVARGELALAAVLTFVLALNNFTVPAILQVKVFPAELWIQFNTTFLQKPGGGLDYIGALRLVWPIVLAPVLLLAWLAWRPVAWPRLTGSVPARLYRRQLGRDWQAGSWALAAVLLALSVGVPLAQLGWAQRTWTELPGAVAAGRNAAWNSFRFAALAASAVIGLAVWAAAVSFQRRAAKDAGDAEGRRKTLLSPRVSAPFAFLRLAVAWLPFFVPGVLLGIVMILILNRPVLAALYQSMGIVVLALAARYFAVGAMAAGHALRSVDTDLVDAARIEGATRWQVLWLALWPQVAPQIAAAWYVIYLLCLWDAETLLLIVPPGGETLALRIFNLLHYGHAAQVNALCLTLLGLAVGPLIIVTALVKARSWWRGRPGFRVPMSAAAGALVLAVPSGCAPQSGNDAVRLDSRFFERAEIIGTRGVGAGEFNKPRSLAVDRQDNLYVTDMTGRVQKFSPEGEFLLFWQMPQTDLGKPKGMGCDQDGNIIVVEPHYAQVNHFSTEGKLVAQWGEFGTNAGQLGFPRAVAVDSSGEIFVCEYAAMERVQRFALPVRSPESRVRSQPLTPTLSPPAATARQRGELDGESFLRSESSRFDPQDPSPGGAPPSPHPTGGGQGEGRSGKGQFAGREKRAPPLGHSAALEFSAAPRLLGVIGKAGTGPGEFNRPEGLAVDAQDRLYVADSCNHRIQVFSADGKFLRSFGRAGSGPGELSYPYDVVVDKHGHVFVCEFGNSRVQVFDTEGKPLEIIGGPGAEPGRFANPWSMALDSRGNLCVADSQNHRVQKLVRRMGQMGRMAATNHGLRTSDY